MALLDKNTATEAGRHIPELDAIRAAAILFVLANHLLETPPADLNVIAKFPSVLRVIIHHGFLGVDVFFVLSGYLITTILLRSRALGIKAYFGRFYKRRAQRILPLYFTILLAIGIFTAGSFMPFFIIATAMSANLAALLGITVPAASGPYWSLAVEEQFYLIWPLLVLWLPRRILLAVTTSLIVIEPFLRYAVHAKLLELTWFHSDGLAAGATIAVILFNWKGEKQTICIVAGAFLLAFVVETISTLPLLEQHVPGIEAAIRISQASLLSGLAIVLAIGFSGSRLLSFLRIPFLRATATWSFCIYLVHRPLVEVFQHVAFRLVPRLDVASPVELTILRSSFVLACSYAVAALSWRYFEQPILRGRFASQLFVRRSETPVAPP